MKDDYSEEIFYTLRGLAMYLHNEKIWTDKAFRIIKILLRPFDYVDDLKQTAYEDLKILEVARTYAITSKNKDILSTVQKHLNDCEKILSQRNSSGCIIFIVVILTAMLIGIF